MSIENVGVFLSFLSPILFSLGVFSALIGDVLNLDKLMSVGIIVIYVSFACFIGGMIVILIWGIIPSLMVNV